MDKHGVRTTREVVAKGWEDARRCADEKGAFMGTPVSVAGQYLELAHGDAAAARRLLPQETASVFWSRVDAALAAIAAEERDIQARRAC